MNKRARVDEDAADPGAAASAATPFAAAAPSPSARERIQQVVARELAMYQTQSPAVADAVQRHHYQAHHAQDSSSNVSSATALFEACIVNGDLETVRLLLDHGVRVEAHIGDGYEGFPVHTACEYGQLEILKVLISHGAHVNGGERRSFGRSPLAIACYHGHFEIVVWLVENGALVNDQNLQGETPLVEAVYRGELQIARYLVSMGANAASKLRPLKSAWHLAVKYGRLDILKCFVESRFADLTRDEQLQMHLLQCATKGENIGILQYLLALGVFGASKMNECLGIATKLQNIEIMKLLVAFGADVNVYNKSGESPLTIAIQHGMVDATETLLSLGADVNKVEGSGSELSAIHTMTIHGRLDLLKLVRRICGAAADFEAPSERERCTPLHLAAYAGHADIVRFLLEVSSPDFDINIEFYRNDTALTLAARGGHLEVVRLLASGGAAVNRQTDDVSGPPALFCAAEFGHYDVVKFLCENGANDLWRRFDGLSALSVAARKGRAEIVELLTEVWQSAGIADIALHARTALREAVSHGHTGVARVLLARNDFAGDSQAQWPALLCEAILFNEKESARLLIKHGAGINTTYSLTEDDDGDLTLTPLHVAAGLGNLGLVKYLCEQGADVEGLSNEDETALFFAAARGKLNIVQYLVSEQNANVQSSSSYGFTPSEVAVAGGHRQVFEYLISHGALLPKRDILDQESCDRLTSEQDGTGEEVLSTSDLAVDAEYWYRCFAFASFLSRGYT